MRTTSLAALEKSLPKLGSNRAKIYQFIIDKQEYGAKDQEVQPSSQKE